MLKHLLENRPYLIVPFKIGCQHHDTIELTQNAPSIEIAVKVVVGVSCLTNGLNAKQLLRAICSRPP